MSGDIGNAFERLRRLLPKIKYHGPMDQTMAMAGAPEVLLPLLHYIFLGYSRDLAKFVSNAGYELMGRSDMQFTSDCFRMLCDLFGYNPSITSKQFLARGFAERKLHLMSDIIALALEKKKRLAPVSHSSQIRRQSVQAPSVIRTVFNASDQDSSPSPRMTAPPVPTAKFPMKTSAVSLDDVSALAERLAAVETMVNSMEKMVKSLSDTLPARITIIEGRIRFLEQKLAPSDPSPDREEQEKGLEPPRESSVSAADKAFAIRKEQHISPERSERIQAMTPSYSYQGDRERSAPVKFADRMNSAENGESLRDAFTVLSQTPDSTFVQNLLTRVEQTDLLLSTQPRAGELTNTGSVRPIPGPQQ